MIILSCCDNFQNQLILEYFAEDPNDGLLKAAQINNLELAKLFINNGACLCNWPLYYASFNGNLELVQLLVKKGGWDYNYAMYCAFEGGHSNIVKFFEDKGAKSWNYDHYKFRWQSMGVFSNLREFLEEFCVASIRE